MTATSIINNAVWITAADLRRRPVCCTHGHRATTPPHPRTSRNRRHHHPIPKKQHLREVGPRSQGPRAGPRREGLAGSEGESVHQHLSAVTAARSAR